MTRRDWLRTVGAASFGTAVAKLRGGQTTPRSTTAPDVELELAAAPADVRILPGAPTKVWRFSGRLLKGPAGTLQELPDSYLGPTIRLERGQRVRVHFLNRLPDPSIVHWHGLDVPQESDGHPRLAIAGGGRYTYEFEVTNRAGTYWYHPHPHMQTGPQVYSGLAGLLLVGDSEERALGLPAAGRELHCIIQDRRFDRGNQLVYSTAMMDMETGMLGDVVLVNGRSNLAWSLGSDVYRLRILNGSNARIYKLGWSDGTPVTILGVDGGLLERPLVQRFVTLAPGQRVDTWLDLRRQPIGTTIRLESAAFDLADGGLSMGGRGMGMGRGAGRGAAMASGGGLPLGAPITLCSITVARRVAAEAALPDRLSAYDRTWTTRPTVPAREVPLSFQMMEWRLGGRIFEMEGVAPDETVPAGATRVWEFVNAGGPMGMHMAHPIHLHGRQFRVLGRSGGAPDNSLREGLVDAGWLDTVLVLPRERVRIQVTFGSHTGLFLYHCHILEHEDMGMMRNFRILPAAV